MSAPHATDIPPGASPTALRLSRALRRPLERFLQIQAASGLVLLVAAGVALVWANSPWSVSYQAFWDTRVHIGAAGHTIDTTVRFLVDDVLMSIFFFVVGLEIRREIHAGELSNVKRAALPLVAALGGMVVPALIYLALNRGEAARGWGVPMATDIAFAVGVLALLGSRVAPSLRVFLLALAIVDDLGAILVIAVFYSTGFDLRGVALAGIGLAGIVAMQRLGVRSAVAYVVPAVVLWAGVLIVGIHPTIAGVIVGLMTPAVAWYGPQRFLAAAHLNLGTIAEKTDHHAHDLAEPLSALRRAQREALSPVERIETMLHPWVAFAIMPVFALANAGVDLGGVDLGAMPGVAIGIVAGLVVGKFAGIVGASAIAVRLGVASLPRGVTWRGVAIVGMVAGIGFTMALFVTELAFANRAELHGAAKLGVLIASAIAGLVALIAGRLMLPRSPKAGAAATVHDAETSNEI